MAKLTWENRAAKRRLAEAGLELALVQIRQAADVGGPRCSVQNLEYKEALAIARHVERLLTQAEEIRD